MHIYVHMHMYTYELTSWLRGHMHELRPPACQKRRDGVACPHVGSVYTCANVSAIIVFMCISCIL